MYTLSTVVDEIPPLFCQLDELQRGPFGEYQCWKEKSRWVRFEEQAESVLGRWSKPYVATIPQTAMDGLKELVQDSFICLDLKLGDPKEINEFIGFALKENYFEGSQNTMRQFIDILNLPHFHHHQLNFEKTLSSMNLAKLGSSHSFTDTTTNTQNTPAPTNQTTTDEFKENTKFKRKVHTKAEGASVLVAPIDAITRPKLVFIRFQSATLIPSLLELKIASRFMVIICGPVSRKAHLYEIGRAISTCLADDFCREYFYAAQSREDILSAVNHLSKSMMVIPPSEWDPKIRIEPPEKYLSKEDRKAAPEITDYIHSNVMHEESHADPTLVAEKTPFIGLIKDAKNKIPWLLSDITDSLNVQCIAATLYMYLVSLCSLVAFGALLGQGTNDYMATMECILAGCICGVLFALFAGQPLNILSATGPMLILEKIVSSLCEKNGLDFMEFRLWIGIWIGVFLFIFVVFNLSFLVKFITRFTEDCFASLVAIMFIIDAIKSLLSINKVYPTRFNGAPDILINRTNCSCNASEISISAVGFNFSFADLSKIKSANECVALLYGNWSCVSFIEKKGFYADVFIFSVLLFFFTFFICMALKGFRNSSFLPAKARSMLSDFAVLIAILAASILNGALGIDTPKLTVPSEFKPTRSDRGWIIPFFSGKNSFWTIFVAIGPAIIATLLVFMDQQITAVIVNRKEFKLKKGHGYHLDLFILAINITLCSILGLPWFVAATVLALTHINAIKVTSENSAPGEKPVFLGVREQRMTCLIMSILIGLSVFLTKILNYIPMPVLYAVFLYMGVSALGGLQFIDRILIFFMPAKYQPDYPYLRHVDTYKVHFFTFFQICSIAAMFIVKQIDAIAITFPLLVVFTCVVRKFMDGVFTQNELYWLDALLPGSKRDADAAHVHDEAKALENCATAANLVSSENNYTNLAYDRENGVDDEKENGKDLEISL